MTKRLPYISLLLAVAGGFVVLTTFAFASGTANWIDFGIAVAATAGGLGVAVARPLGRRRYAAGGGLTALIGAWTVLVALGIFSGTTQQWLVFASGAALALIGLAGVVSVTRLLQAAGVATPPDPAAINGQVGLGQRVTV